MLSSQEIIDAIKLHEIYLELRASTPLHAIQEQLTGIENKPRIIIENFTEKPSHEGGRLNPNSYNLTLADELYVYDGMSYAGPWKTVDFREISVEKPISLYDVKPLDTRAENKTSAITIPESGYCLMPGILYLGSTREWTESYNVAPRLDGRSSTGRLGISVHATAAFGDNGFCGRWTLEIMVVHPVIVYPGDQICQISYDTLGKAGFYYQSKKYQNQQGVVPSKMYMDQK